MLLKQNTERLQNRKLWGKNKEMSINKKNKGKNADISIRELWNADKDLNLNGIP